MATNVIRGIQSTMSTPDSLRPPSKRLKLYEYFANGDLPITGIMGKMGTAAPIKQVKHTWAVQAPPLDSGDLGSSPSYVFTDSAFATAYAGIDNYASGRVVYVKVTDDALAQQIIVDNLLMLCDKSDRSNITRGIVVGVTLNSGANCIAVKLLESDPASRTNGLELADYVHIYGSAHAEGSGSPESIQYLPTEFENRTQIWKNSLKFTGTELSTEIYYGGDTYKIGKKRTFYLHGRDMEKSALFGIKTVTRGRNNQEVGTAMGLVQWINNYCLQENSLPRYVFDYTSDTHPIIGAEFNGKTWLERGEQWLGRVMQVFNAYGETSTPLAICGSGAIKAINDLSLYYAQRNLSTGQSEFGLKVTKFVTPFGELDLKVHPLMANDKIYTNSVILVRPQKMAFRPLSGRDTMFKKDTNMNESSVVNVDGITEEYLTEGTFEFQSVTDFAILHGLGEDNAS